MHFSSKAQKIKKIHPEKISDTPGMTLILINFHTLGNENPEKIPYIFSYLGKQKLSKVLYISGNGTFLYFRRNFQDLKNQNLLYFSKKSYE